MCRSIKRLRTGSERASDSEIEEAALQFVRKVSGYTRPSQVNEEVFNLAVNEIAGTARRLLDSLIYRGAQRASAAE